MNRNQTLRVVRKIIICAKCHKELKRGLRVDGTVPKHRLSRRTSWDHQQADYCPASGTKLSDWTFSVETWKVELKNLR